MKTVLVTGANGFVGNHLIKELSDNGIKVIGVGGAHHTSPEKSPYISDYVVLDLMNGDEARQIDFSQIDGVIHLAGLAAPGPSFDQPLEYIATNMGIEINLFEAALAQSAQPRFLIISSGTLYDQKAPMPFTETSPVCPSSPYAVSKIGQEQLAQYYGVRGFECVIARPFNHIGPGQNPGFIVPDIAKQVVEFEKGLIKELSVGNLESKRDYTDVRDIVRAYRLLLEKGKSGETYNICSGTALSGHDILAQLVAAADSKPDIVQDSEKTRPSDRPVLYGSHNKITEDTGWQPEIPLEKTLSDVIEDWRSRA